MARRNIGVWDASGHRSIGALLLIVLLVAASCGQTQMVETSAAIRKFVIEHNYAAALETLRTSKGDAFGEQDRVLYWMNEGMLSFLNGDYQVAVDVLTKAEDRSKELYTVSISKEVEAAFTSQAATDYQGEDYEKVLINVVKALAFLEMNDLEGALVEARKINEKLEYLNTQYEEHKNVYREDAFAHWLMGVLFEEEGSYDDARIAYRAATRVYAKEFASEYGVQAPSWLAEDLARAAVLSADNELLERVRKNNGDEVGKTAKLLDSHGEVILFHLNGRGPSKSDFYITCYFETPVKWLCGAVPGGKIHETCSYSRSAKGHCDQSCVSQDGGSRTHRIGCHAPVRSDRRAQ